MCEYPVNSSLKTYKLFFCHFKIIGELNCAFPIENTQPSFCFFFSIREGNKHGYGLFLSSIDNTKFFSLFYFFEDLGKSRL